MPASPSNISPVVEESKSKSTNLEEEDITKVKRWPPLKRVTKEGGYAYTKSLVELFQIRIDKFDEMERRGEVYGKVEVVDLDHSHTLYHRERGSPEHVWANYTISLTGSPRAISNIIGFAVNIDLSLCGDLEDVALCKWQLSWDALNPEVAYITRGQFLEDFNDRPDKLLSEANCKYNTVGYDQPLSAVFEGPNGCCVTMFYSIIKHAVQACVLVEVIDIKGVPSIIEYNVRGSIYATYSCFERGNDSSIKDQCRTTLLNTRHFESVKAQRWKKIQLSRSIIAVPVYSSLIIEADLWDSSQLKIAQGKVEFNAYHRGYGIDYIRGDDDLAIRVMVFWAYGSQDFKHFPIFMK